MSRHHRCLIGARPDVFLPQGCGGPPGGEGQFVLWDQPCTYISNPRDVSLYGTGLDMLWVAGDGNRPTIWQGAALAPGDPDPLSVVGAPVAEVAPYQLEGAVDVALEGHTGASYRRSLVPRDPAAGQDGLLLVFGRCPLSATNTRFLSTRTGAQGYELYYSNPGQVSGFIGTAAGWITPGPAAGHVAAGGLFVAALAHDRAADQGWLWTPGGIAAPAAVADGAIVGGGIGIGAWPDGTTPLGAGGGLIACAYLIGAGIAAQWAADTYYKCRELRHRLCGTWPRQGGMPTFARASARSRQDRNGRWWIYSSGMPAAGDSNDFRVAGTRTNKAYRNTGIPLGALAEWIGDDASTATGVADAAALAAAGLQDWGPNVASYANASGASRYLRCGAASGAGGARHALSVFARIVAGAGAQIGWWDTTGGTFTSVGAISNAYARTVFDELVPPSATCYLAIHVPNGCTLYWLGHQCESSGSAVMCKIASPIPNTAAGSTALRPAESHDTLAPADAQGSVELAITPIGWSDRVGGSSGWTTVISRDGGLDRIVYPTSAAPYRWATEDGTVAVSGGGAAPADGVRQVVRVRWGVAGQRVDVDGSRGSGTYDGTRVASGKIRLQANDTEIAVRNFRIYRNGSG